MPHTKYSINVSYYYVVDFPICLVRKQSRTVQVFSEAPLSGALEPHSCPSQGLESFQGSIAFSSLMEETSLDLNVQLRVFFLLFHLPGKVDISHVYFLKKFARKNA